MDVTQSPGTRPSPSASLPHRVLGLRAQVEARATAFALHALAGGLAFVLLRRGAYFWPDLKPAAIAAAGIAAVLLAVAGRGDGSRTVALAAAVLGGGLVASAAANGWPASIREPLATVVVGLAAYLLAARVARAESPHTVLTVVVTLGALVALAGLVALAFHIRPWLTPLNRTWRVASTLTYSNAAAAVFAMSLPAALLLGSGRTRRAAAARAAAAIIGVGLAGTLSRGGIIAAAAGLAVLAIRRAVPWRDTIAPAVGTLFGAAAIVPALTGAVNGSAVSAKEAAGVFAAIVLAAGIGSLSLDAPMRRRIVAGAGIALIVAGAAAIPATHIGATRLTTSSDDRARVWSATWRQALERPLVGSGPGTYRLVGVQGDSIVLTRHAHNEYLEAFAETGAAGVASIAVAAALLIGSALRRRPRTRETPGAHVWTVAVAGGVAFAVHSGLDFLWRIPAVVALAFVLLAVAVHAAHEKEHAL